MATIAIDIDETLYSFDGAIRDVFFDMAEERDDKKILRLAYSNNYEWRNLTDHSKSLAYEAIERVHENTFMYQLFPDAWNTVWEIESAGHEIKYVGSRKDKHQRVTEDTIYDSWDLPDGEVICADPQNPKVQYLKDCQYLIDDRPKTIFDFLNSSLWDYEEKGVRKAFALWRPYNQNLTEVKNLYLAPTWRGLRFYLARKGVI